MIGRIVKHNNVFHCVIGGKTYPIILDAKDKIYNGDLVKIDDSIDSNFTEVNRSQLLVLKRIPLEVNVSIIDGSTPLYKRLENRILDLRSTASHARFFVRSEIKKILAQLFDTNGYVNVDTPLITGAVAEGRVKNFEIDFFGSKSLLTMTKLVHLRYLICSDFEKVYDSSPVFVAGQQNTPNHIAEYHTFDWATSERVNFDKYLLCVDNILSELITKLLQFIKSASIEINFECESLLEEIKHVKVVTYTELVDRYLTKYPEDKKILEQFHLPGRVISFAHNCYGNYYWVTEFPEKFKQFYCETISRNDKNIVLSSELWWRNVKVGSVSFSNSDNQKTLDRIKLLGLTPKNFKTYLDAINLASPEAYLGSLYIERLMMVLLNIDNIKETLMFPRAARGTVLDP